MAIIEGLESTKDILQYLNDKFGITDNPEAKAWYQSLSKTAASKNITVPEWNSLVMRVATNVSNAEALRNALTAMVDAIDDFMDNQESLKKDVDNLKDVVDVLKGDDTVAGSAAASIAAAISKEIDRANSAYVPKGRKVNDKALTADIVLSAADVGAVPSGRKVNDKTLDSDITLDASNFDDIYSKTDADGKIKEAAGTAFANAKTYTDETESKILNKFSEYDTTYKLEYKNAHIVLTSSKGYEQSIDATPFIKDGMLSSAKIEDGFLVLTFNTGSGIDDTIRVDLKEFTDVYGGGSTDTITVGVENGTITASVRDKAITAAHLSDTIVNSLNRADSALQANDLEELEQSVEDIAKDYLTSTDRTELENEINVASANFSAELNKVEDALKTITDGVGSEEIDSFKELVDWANTHAGDIAGIQQGISGNTSDIATIKPKVAELDSELNTEKQTRKAADDALDAKIEQHKSAVANAGFAKTSEVEESLAEAKSYADSLLSGLGGGGESGGSGGSSVTGLAIDNSTLKRDPSTGLAHAVALRNTNTNTTDATTPRVLKLFTGPKAEYEALSADAKAGVLAFITDDTLMQNFKAMYAWYLAQTAERIKIAYLKAKFTGTDRYIVQNTSTYSNSTAYYTSEIGTVITNSLEFSWFTYSSSDKDEDTPAILSFKRNNNVLTSRVDDGDEEPGYKYVVGLYEDANGNNYINSDTTFSLSVADKYNNTFTKNITFDFKYKIFYGVTNAAFSATTDWMSKLTSSWSDSHTNLALSIPQPNDDQYIYYCYPNVPGFTDPDFKLGASAFWGGMDAKAETISYGLSNGRVLSYVVYVSGRGMNLGKDNTLYVKGAE